MNLHVAVEDEGVGGVQESRSRAPPDEEHHLRLLTNVGGRGGEVAEV